MVKMQHAHRKEKVTGWSATSAGKDAFQVNLKGSGKAEEPGQGTRLEKHSLSSVTGRDDLKRKARNNDWVRLEWL